MQKVLSLALLASVLLAAPAGAQNAALEVLNYQDGGSTFTAKWTGAGFPPNQSTAPSGYTFVAQWPDGYGDRAGGRSILGAAGDVVQGGGDNYQRDFGVVLNSGPTLGPAEMVVQGTLVACDYYCNSTRSNVEVATGKKVAFTSGQTLVQVAGYDAQKSAVAGHAVFGPVPGATVKIYEQYGGANFPKSAVVRQFSISGNSFTALTVGFNPGGSPTDCAYPSGFASNQFKISASAPGFKDVLPADEAQATGSAMPGAAFIVTLYPSNRPENSTAAGSGTTTPDGLSNANVPPPAGTGTTDGGNGGGDGTDDGSGNFFSGFWDTFKQTMHDLFIPSDAQIASLKTSSGQLFNYGPLGVAADFKQIWDNSFNAYVNLDDGDGTYWRLPLRFSDTALAATNFGNPAGYNHPGLGESPGGGQGWLSNFFPLYIDLAEWQRYIIIQRGIMKCLIWSLFVYGAVRKFLPSVKV